MPNKFISADQVSITFSGVTLAPREADVEIGDRVLYVIIDAVDQSRSAEILINMSYAYSPLNSERPPDEVVTIKMTNGTSIRGRVRSIERLSLLNRFRVGIVEGNE
jgi:hypothetical protein